MTHEEMFEYLKNTQIKDLLPPLVYKQYFKHNVHTKGWTGIELAVAIAQNNNAGYQLMLPETQKVIETDNTLVFQTDCGEIKIDITFDENILKVIQYKKHAQLAIVKYKDQEQYFAFAVSAPTEKEARSKLNEIICNDIIKALNIKTPRRFNNLYSESMMIFRQSSY